MKKHIILQPTCIKHFKCIGSECEDSCCIGWKISIDKTTFKNYKNVKDKEFKKKIERYIKRDRHSICTQDYAKINLLDNKNCPFLNEKKLCDMFINLGQNSMSNVCKSYPRIYNHVDNIFEKSLTVSCPTAAKMVLLNKEPLEFEEIEVEEDILNIKRDKNIKNEKITNKLYDFFWDIRIFTISLLQNREYSLEDRLLILGFFYKEISTSKNIEEIITQFNNRIFNGVYKEVLSNIQENIEMKLEILNNLINIQIEDINENKFIDFNKKCINGLGFNNNGEITIGDMKTAYNKAYNQYYLKYMSDKGYILENFLVNYVFQELLPISDFNVFTQYGIMIVYYSIIKMHLIGLSAYYKENFSEDIVVNFLQQFSKFIIHNVTFTNWINDILCSNNLNNMPYITILLKS